MGNVALSLRSLNHTVAGSDAGIYPPMSDVLSAAAIELHQGFEISELLDWKPDLVVVGNAVSRGNAQLEYLLEHRSIPFTSMPEAIRRFLLADRDRLVVAGTHGKTTTSSAAAFALHRAGRQPGYLIGGVPLDLSSGSAAGDPSAPFVIEGDEYDSAIFDKRSKFQHYFPNVLVINNLEFDHGDIFRDEGDYLRSFQHLVRLVPKSGSILINADDVNCQELAIGAFSNVISIGVGPTSDYRIVDFEDSGDGSSFQVEGPNDVRVGVNSPLNGDFNARNLVMAAVGSAAVLNEPGSWVKYLEILGDFRGVKRRMESRFESKGCRVFEDFGHHPTAIKASIQSLKRRFPDAELWVAFEPRSNTTVTNRFQLQLEDAFSEADILHVAPIFRSDRITPEERLDVARLTAGVGGGSRSWDDWPDFEHYLLSEFTDSGRERILIFFSNGSFNGLITSVTGALNA